MVENYNTRKYVVFFSVFFFNDTATTEIYTLSLHDALPIFSFSTIYEIKGAKTTPMALTYDDYNPDNNDIERQRIGQIMYETTQFSYLTLPVILNRKIGTSWKFGAGVEPSVILVSPIGVDYSKKFDLAFSCRIAYYKGKMEYSLKYTHGFFDVLENPFIDKAHQRGVQFSVFYRIFIGVNLLKIVHPMIGLPMPILLCLKIKRKFVIQFG